MLNTIEFYCDACMRECETFTDIRIVVDAEVRLANKGWLVKGTGGRMWHFCPACKVSEAQYLPKPQLTGPGDPNA